MGMADSDIIELQKQHRAGQDKYTYFLLAVAASAVAFSVQKTSGLKMAWSMIPVGLAVLAWGVSFFFGCKNLLWVQASISANFSLLHLQRGIHQEQPAHHQESEVAIRGVKSALDKNMDMAAYYAKGQFLLLVLGALFFLAWHITEMLLRTFPPQS